MSWTNWQEACARAEARRLDLWNRQAAAHAAAQAREPVRQWLIAAWVRKRMGRYTSPALERRDTLVMWKNEPTHAERVEIDERWDAILKAMGGWWLPPMDRD